MTDVLANLDALQVRRESEQRRKYPKQFLGIDPAAFVSEMQSKFIDYMLDPDHGTQAQFARDNDVDRSTISQWKKERFFMEEWDKRAKRVNGGPERVQRVVDGLYAAAIHGDVKAMQLYLQYVEKSSPPKKVVEDEGGIENMSDEQLATYIEQLRKGA